jgi:hypothetical protein
MFIETKKITNQYTRKSKSNLNHTYRRSKTLAILVCDQCDQQFERELGKMDYRRLNNNYFHVCPNCNPKQFAQKKSTERRTLWNLPVDSDKKINGI